MRRFILSLCFVALSGCSSQVRERVVSIPNVASEVHATSNTFVETKTSGVLELHQRGEAPSLSLPSIEMPRIHLPQYDLPESRAPMPSREYRLPGVSIESPHLPIEPSWRTPEWSFRPDLQVGEWAGLQPEWTFPFDPPDLAAELQLKPGAKLRPRSPYCMPGHLSQNFVVTSLNDGLPLHPGVW